MHAKNYVMGENEKVNIDWDYDTKSVDPVFGNGATKQEKSLGWIACFVIPAFLVYYVSKEQLHWSYIQWAVGLFIAADVGGGMICNALNSCKRFYLSPVRNSEKGYVSLLKNKLIFSSVHIHTILVGLLFDIAHWYNGVIWYLLLMISVVVVDKTPLYLKRPLSMLILLFAIMINLYLIIPVRGFEWLVPVLFIKIVYGHLVREEPYRP